MTEEAKAFASAAISAAIMPALETIGNKTEKGKDPVINVAIS